MAILTSRIQDADGAGSSVETRIDIYSTIISTDHLTHAHNRRKKQRADTSDQL
jgi:hypothetical protein